MLGNGIWPVRSTSAVGSSPPARPVPNSGPVPSSCPSSSGDEITPKRTVNQTGSPSSKTSSLERPRSRVDTDYMYYTGTVATENLLRKPDGIDILSLVTS